MNLKMFTHGIGLRLCLGFSVMVLLMVALSIIGLKHTAQVNSLMKHIVEENNIKIEMAQIMQNALQ